MPVYIQSDDENPAENDSLNRLVSLNEVAEFLGVDKRTLSRIRNSHSDFPKPANFCPGRKRPSPRFLLSEIAQWAERQR